jgi:DNA-binding MarR family transcriptional regulator
MPSKSTSTPKNGHALASRYTFRVTVASTLIARMTEMSIGQQLNLSVPQWRILLYLHSRGQGGVREIARFHHYTDSQVSRAVQDLVSRGLLERLEAEADRRLAAARLTATGAKAVEEALPGAVARNQRLANAIAAPDRAAFERALEALTREAQTMIAEMQAQDKAARKAAPERATVNVGARKQRVSPRAEK